MHMSDQKNSTPSSSESSAKKEQQEAREIKQDERKQAHERHHEERVQRRTDRHLRREQERETERIIELDNELQDQEAQSDAPDDMTEEERAILADVESSEAERILHAEDEISEQEVQQDEASESETASTPSNASSSTPSSAQGTAHTTTYDPDVARQRSGADERIGLFGSRRRSFSSEYHLTRRSRLNRLRHIARIAMQFNALQGLTPVNMRLMFEALGPTFVKVGQILSMRSEILPPAFCDELAKLRADADPMPYSIVVETLENEYKRPISEVFAHIDTTPLGSASLAQVHRATLLTGEDVAVKVQRPGVRVTMAEDVSLLRSLARSATRIMRNAQIVDFQGVVEELWDTFDEETNFLNEAHNLAEFKRFCSHYAYMDCPTPYIDLCTEHVLVMEYIQGIPIAHTQELIDDGYSLKEIGTKLVDNYAAQILDAGFFHADPHPGNIEIRGGQIVFLDLGMTGRLNAATRNALRQMIFAVGRQNASDLAETLLRFAGTEADRVNYPSLLSDLDNIIDEFGTVDLADLDLSAFLTQLTQLASRHGIEVPSSVTTVGRALVTLEGLIDKFIPDVNMIQIISMHIVNSKTPKQRLQDEAQTLALEGNNALHGGLKAVAEAHTALHMLTRGELQMNVGLVSSHEPLQQISDMVNRITMAMIVVGLFIGSSIVYYAGMKPIIFGIPVVGFAGYVVAFFLSCWIVLDIYLQRRQLRKMKRK